MTIFERSPVMGSSVIATPAAEASTIFCTPTDISVSQAPMLFFAR